MSRYIHPGRAATESEPEPVNAYRPPSGPAPQLEPRPQPVPPPAEPAPPPTAHPPPPREASEHATLFGAWREHHGDAWLIAPGLHQTVRALVDHPRGRIEAVKQKLPKLVGTTSGAYMLESRATGHGKRRALLYRLAARDDR